MRARSDNPGRPSELSGQALAEWQKDLERGRWRSVPQLQRWLAQTHGVKLALSSLDDRRRKVRARRRVPRQSHCKKDPAAGLEFRTELAARRTALVRPPGRPVRLWVLDEMRYGLHGFTRRVGGLPGHRPVVPTQQKYQWGFVDGAVGVGLSRPEFLLTETMEPSPSPEVLPADGPPTQRTRRDGLVYRRSVPLAVALGGDGYASVPPAAPSSSTDRLLLRFR